MSHKKGKWVVFDGIDAVGKSTQMRLCSQILKEKYFLKVCVFEEFSTSPIGDVIRGIIEKQRFYALSSMRDTPRSDSVLLLADTIYKAEKQIATADEADIIISDRDISSFIAYQAIRMKEQGIIESAKTLRSMYRLISQGLRKPDLHIIYDLDIEEVNRRVQKRGEKSLSEAEAEFLRKVREELFKVTATLPHVIIDVNKSSQREITEQTISTILEHKQH